MSLDQLLEYLGGELDADADERFEEELMAGAFDGRDLDDTTRLLVTLREAAFTGVLNITVTPEEIDKLRELGYRILDVQLVPGDNTPPSLNDVEFELLHLTFELDLRGVERLDCATCLPSGEEIKRTVEIPFTDGQTRIDGFCARDLALAGVRALPGGNLQRFLDVKRDGTERVIAEFRVHW
jgi:hypothetical protein